MAPFPACSERARLDAPTQQEQVRALSAFFKPRERNKRKMLLRTARAAPRLLRTAHRHKASAVAALHDDDEAQKTIAKVVSRYARTQEQLVPWFLEQMPRSYFSLVPESSQLAHLQAAAGLFDPARGFHQCINQNVAARLRHC